MNNAADIEEAPPPGGIRFSPDAASEETSRAPDAVSLCDVQADISRNVIRVAYSGRVTPTKMESCFASVKAALPQMAPGFTVLSDLSRLESMELDCVTYLTKIMDACQAGGVASALQVIPNPAKDIGFTILGIVHYRRGVRVVTCKTIAEAEQKLRR